MKISKQKILFTFVGIVALLSILALTLFLYFSSSVKLNIHNNYTVQAESKTFLGVRWLEKEWFLHGVNMPWIRWGCDFGGPCSDGYDGVSQEDVQQRIRQRFSTLREANVHVVRWWLFPQFNYGLEREDFAETIIAERREIRIDTETYYQYFPIRISFDVFKDIDKAIEIADEYDIYYNFTIFSSMHAIPMEWVIESEYRDALVRVLGELFSRYANHPRILAWEVVNEPEFASSEYGGEASTYSMDEIIRFVSDIVAEQRRVSPRTLVNIGPAFIANTREDYRYDIINKWFQSGINPDFISPHYYDYMDDNINIFRTDANRLRSLYGSKTIPIVIGEGYLGDPVDANERLERTRSLGYAGFWGWSLFPESTYDRMEIDWDGVSTYGNNYADNGPRQTLETPTNTPTPINTPTPTSTNTPTPTSTSAPTPTSTNTPTPTSTNTPTPTPTPTNTPTLTTTPTSTPTTTPTNTPTQANTISPTPKRSTNNQNASSSPTPTKKENTDVPITNSTASQPTQTPITEIAQKEGSHDVTPTTNITDAKTSETINASSKNEIKRSNLDEFLIRNWLFYCCGIILLLLVMIPLLLPIINRKEKNKSKKSSQDI